MRSFWSFLLLVLLLLLWLLPAHAQTQESLDGLLIELRENYMTLKEQFKSLTELYENQQLSLIDYERALTQVQAESDILRQRLANSNEAVNDLRRQLTDSREYALSLEQQVAQLEAASQRLKAQLDAALNSLDESSEYAQRLTLRLRVFQVATGLSLVGLLAALIF